MRLIPKPIFDACNMKSQRKQKGVALLIAMMALLSGSALFLINGYRAGIQNDRLESLLAAKQALMAYAVNYADNYGHNTRGGTGRLPCPSLQRHSSPATSCSANDIGYLPSVWMRDQRLMEIDYLERFFDQDIWYSIAADHRYNPSYNSLNSYNGDGLLSVDAMTDVVAVLISPGQPLEFQNRTGAVGQHPSSIVNDYLEGSNSDLDDDFTLTNQNDLVVVIRRSELVPLMERRVLGFVKQWLIEYKQEYGYYPYASEPGGTGECIEGLSRGMIAEDNGSCSGVSMLDIHYQNLPHDRLLRNTWFARSGWPALIYYVVDDSCTVERGVTDCDNLDDPVRTLRVNGEPVEVILISVGAPIETLAAGGMQTHGATDLMHYLDTDSLMNAQYEFSIPVRNNSSNDQLVFIN